MNPVVHFEMPYEDRDRAAKFYQTAFGWKAQMTGPEMGETGVGPRRKDGGASAPSRDREIFQQENYRDYVVMQTSETDDKGMIKKPGNINGGMFKKTPENGFTSIVISVDDINEAMKKVEEAGGKVTFTENGQPMEIPGIGLYVGITDSEGNRVSMLQPKNI